MINGMSGSQMIFQAGQVGVHHLGVALQREDQSHIDIDSRGNGMPNGRYTFLRGRDLDHEVGPGDTRPKLLGLCGGRIRIMSITGLTSMLT